MRKFLAIAIVFAFVSMADAGPFGVFGRRSSCPGGTCDVAPSIPQKVTPTPPRYDAVDAIDEVNAARAERGLPPFIRDEGLTVAAKGAAAYRAERLIAGHANDFSFLPVGVECNVAGCGALAPSWGWGTCCTYSNHVRAGAALVIGRDGKRYMHLFVTGGSGREVTRVVTRSRFVSRR